MYCFAKIYHFLLFASLSRVPKPAPWNIVSSVRKEYPEVSKRERENTPTKVSPAPQRQQRAVRSRTMRQPFL